MHHAVSPVEIIDADVTLLHIVVVCSMQWYVGCIRKDLQVGYSSGEGHVRDEEIKFHS